MCLTFSYDIKPEKTNMILDIRNSTNHPLSLLYSEIYNSVLLDAKLQDGRSQPGFSLKGKSPFFIAAKKAVESGSDKKNQQKRIVKVFQSYYESVIPNNAAEWLGINFKKNHTLYSQPPWAAVFPWRARSIKSYRLAYENAAINENKLVGYKDINIQQGWLFCGPVSNQKLLIEAQRMALVLKSIQENGYQRSNEKDGDAKATALVREDNEWRWLVTSGNHRVSAASAIGYNSIPLRINNVICRNQVDYWPHVINGLYTKKQALDFFDMIFNGDTPILTTEYQKLIEEI